MFFTEALTEPLQGWVKYYRPTTLADSINRTRDLQDVVRKNRFPPRTNVPIKAKDRKPWPKKEWMDNDTQQDLRRKKLCFTCQEPWVPGHICSGKGKAYYIEAYSDNGEDDDYPDQEQRETPETVRELPPSGGTTANHDRGS